MNLEHNAMLFAREAHREQRRKYTGLPYFTHLAEVAALTASAASNGPPGLRAARIAVAWLHDSMEDQGVPKETLDRQFGQAIADGVELLSDLATGGSRAERAAASRARLARAPGWIQTVKVADILSNTAAVAELAPDFAAVYLEEKRLQLQVLTQADDGLLGMASMQLALALKLLNQQGAKP